MFTEGGRCCEPFARADAGFGDARSAPRGSAIGFGSIENSSVIAPRRRPSRRQLRRCDVRS
eukprot:8582779-Pyramimonas_sp.AAC.1